MKPENIVIDSQGFPKLTDFGLAKENITKNNLVKTICGTPEYIAPEIIYKQGYGHAVDWWSLGCIIYEMLIGTHPFYVEERREVYKSIVSKPVRILAPINPLASDLIIELLRKDPKKRLGYRDGRDVMKHKWFHDVNWDALINKQVTPSFVPVMKGSLDTSFFSEDFTKMPINESPNADGPIGCSPTYAGFSYSADSQRIDANES